MTAPSSTLLISTPMTRTANIHAPFSLDSSSSTPFVCQKTPQFLSLLESLESKLKRPTTLLSSLADTTVASRAEKQITCLVALPTNQKEVLSFTANENTTFEDLLNACWRLIYPNDETPSYRDYYFLYLQPQKVIRVDPGEYVADFGEFPRFLLRSRYHGIEGSVVSCTTSASMLEKSFTNEPERDMESIGSCVLSEEGMKDVTVSFEANDSGTSVGHLLLSEEQEAECRIRGIRRIQSNL